MKQHLSSLLSFLLCMSGFLVGITLNGVILTMFGISFQKAFVVNIYFWSIPPSIALTWGLSIFSRKLRYHWLIRWGILLELAWIFGICGVATGVFMLSITGIYAIFAVAIFIALNAFIPGLFLSGMTMALFRPLHV